MNRTIVVLTFAAGLLSAACQSDAPQNDRRGDAQTIYSGNYCLTDRAQPSLLRISDAAALERAYAGMRRSVLGSAPDPLPHIDFARDTVLLVSMGQKPTAGYGIILPPNGVRKAGRVLEVHLEWREPPKGAVVAQVVTSPCILLKATGTDYETVRIYDTGGVLRIETRIE